MSPRKPAPKRKRAKGTASRERTAAKAKAQKKRSKPSQAATGRRQPRRANRTAAPHVAPNADAPPAKMGRPRKPFSRHEFEKLCRIQSTIEEVAAWFDMDVDTVQRRVHEEYGTTFAVVFRRYRGHGKVSLRRRQFQKALEGDSRMLKFLGANWLGQRERVEFLSSEEAKLALAESLGVAPDDLPERGGGTTGV